MNEFFQALDAVVGWLNGKIAMVLIPGLLFTGLFLTVRLGFVQVRRLWHGVLVTLGFYDKAGHTGDVSHFAALSTALSATVGVGNIAGVAMAIHFGGPGALFWMWVTAFLGMAVKCTECTLALHYRDKHQADATEGSVSGGPMYYMEKGLGMRPLALFFAGALMITSFFTGNAIQANTLADAVHASFGVPTWVAGLASAACLAAVTLGGIRRIGRITSILAPGMAAFYVAGALVILVLNWEAVLPSLLLIVKQAFTPTAGLTGVGAGSVLAVMTMGVKRGLFSNEAGQGSAPIAHAAAKTEEPVSEGVVALLEPFIDTLMICTLTGLVLITTHVWDERFPTRLNLDAARVVQIEGEAQPAKKLEISQGRVPSKRLTYNDGWVEALFVDAAHQQPFDGVIERNAYGDTVATSSSGRVYEFLHGDAPDLGAPLTARAFTRGLGPLVPWGSIVVTISVVLFALSTAISWSYYGDRCAMYLMGRKAVLPYRLVYCAMHFIGATVAVTSIWNVGDVALSIATIPNIASLLLLSGTMAKMTKSYFERKPWEV